MVNRIKQR